MKIHLESFRIGRTLASYRVLLKSLFDKRLALSLTLRYRYRCAPAPPVRFIRSDMKKIPRESSALMGVGRCIFWTTLLLPTQNRFDCISFHGTFQLTRSEQNTESTQHDHP